MSNDLVVKSNEEIANREKTTNSDLVSMSFKIMEIAQSADRQNVDSMRQCFLRYLQLCQETNTKVTNLSAYMAMGISRNTAAVWARGGSGSNPERQELIRFVNSVCAQQREAMMAEGTLKEITGIFWQKCFDGFRDNDRVVDDGSSLLERDINPDDIIKKYGNLPMD